jgi:hypothetical protein
VTPPAGCDRSSNVKKAVDTPILLSRGGNSTINQTVPDFKLRGPINRRLTGHDIIDLSVAVSYPPKPPNPAVMVSTDDELVNQVHVGSGRPI